MSFNERMSFKGKGAVASLFFSAVVMLGCNTAGNVSTNAPPASANANSAGANTGAANTSAANTGTPPADGQIASGTGVEKEKPAAGKGNVQGKAFYNEKPAEGVEVKLCEKYSQYLGGCGGETFTAKTDGAGEYLIKDVTPRVYEGLLVRVFNTPYYVFARSGIIQAAKYKIEEGRTFFAPDTHLFKSDLKLQSPKAGSKIGGGNIEVKWDAYPDAAYYKFSIFADTSSGAQPEYDFINKRVDGLSYALDKPLSPGSYTCKVEAYNGSDIMLAQSTSDIKFTVTGAAAPAATK